MTIYHFKNDAELLRTEVLPAKKLFIIDAYRTLFLSEPVKGRQALRHGTIDFLNAWQQEKVIYSDDKEYSLIKKLERYGLLSYFSKIYHSKHVNFISGSKLPKDYEGVAKAHCHSIDDAIIIEDWEPDDPRLATLQMDYILIPTPFDMYNAFFKGKQIQKAIKEIRRINSYSFFRLLPSASLH